MRKYSVWVINVFTSSLLGGVLGWLAPPLGDLSPWANLGLSLIRYAIFPLLFCGVSLAVYHITKYHLWKKMLSYYLIFHGAVLALLLVINFLLFWLPMFPIPLRTLSSPLLTFPSALEYIQAILPMNWFQLFTQETFSGLFVFSLLFGYLLAKLYNMTQPLLIILDAFSYLFHFLNRGISYLTVPLVGFLAFVFVQTLDLPLVLSLWPILLQLLGLVCVLTGVYVVALSLYLRESPTQFLRHWFPLLWVAFFYQDSWAIANRAVVRLHEDFNVSMNTYALTISVVSLFHKVGVAFTSSLAFFLVVQSYSYLELPFYMIFWVTGLAYFISLLMKDTTPSSVTVAVSLLFSWYGNGLENSFFILLPLLPFLQGFSYAIDTLHLAFSAFCGSVN